MKNKFKGFILPIALTLTFLLIYYYLALPAINVRAVGFWAMLIIAALIFVATYLVAGNKNYLKSLGAKMAKGFEDAKRKRGNVEEKSYKDYVVYDESNNDGVGLPKWVKITMIAIAAFIAVMLVLALFTSTKVFRARAYQEMLTVTDSDFEKDIKELSFEQIPIVDKDTAERLGKRVVGEVRELVSQFNVADYYSQINYQSKPYRVTPLEYAGFFKWISNKDDGIPYYISIDMATQKTELVELPDGMKYSPSEYFARDLKRHIRFKYPTKMFENLSFEIDDSGAPYWVMSYYKYNIGLFGGKDIAGVILVDAVTGEMKDYPINKVPQWIDLAYSSDLLIKQADNWGTYKNGYLNSLFTQKDVVVTTEGHNYIALNDDVWLYTGITSVVADESNIGFILINMRTKEARTYMINGAEEYSAMESAQGQIQEKSYSATFPILMNVADRPTYFMSLKDNAGLVKSYAFVSVAEYHIVGVGESIQSAKNEYLRLLGVDEDENNGESGSTVTTVSGIIDAISSAVVAENSVYYIIIKNQDGVIYKANISVSDILPFLKAGDNVTFKADEKGRISEIVYTPVTEAP
ncbi:MAG: CvpA family protein [Ruminococcaceae bacterium]|nr:CvpA family protein [Oscillospiraceae bacterium]